MVAHEIAFESKPAARRRAATIHGRATGDPVREIRRPYRSCASILRYASVSMIDPFMQAAIEEAETG